METDKTKENVQLEPPALRGRRQRIKDFEQFIEANRKKQTPTQLVARYSLQTGIASRTVNGYLKLLIDAGIYAKPTWPIKSQILTPEERKVAVEEFERKQEEQRKKREEANPYDF